MDRERSERTPMTWNLLHRIAFGGPETETLAFVVSLTDEDLEEAWVTCWCASIMLGFVEDVCGVEVPEGFHQSLRRCPHMTPTRCATCSDAVRARYGPPTALQVQQYLANRK